MGMRNIQWNEARARLEFAADVLGIAWSEVESIIHQSDDELNFNEAIVDFCFRHCVSIDWVVLGAVDSMIVAFARRGWGRARP